MPEAHTFKQQVFPGRPVWAILGVASPRLRALLAHASCDQAVASSKGDAMCRLNLLLLALVLAAADPLVPRTVARPLTRHPAGAGLTFIAAARIALPQFRHVLERARSPAAPHADELYAIITGTGLDPAVALAFFAYESTYGTKGVTARYQTKNWGNLRVAHNPTRAHGTIRTANGPFAIYPTWQQGLQDWCDLILARYIAAQGLTTVEAAIPVYAPVRDGNAPTAYIATVHRLLTQWQDEGAILTIPPHHTVVW